MPLQLPRPILILATSLFITLTANATFFAKVLEAYPANLKNSVFLASVPIVLCCIITLLLALTCFRHTTKWVLAFTLITSALIAYFTDNFGAVIDTTMIRNALQTDTAEARDLLTGNLLLRLILLGVLPTLFIWTQSSNAQRWTQELISAIKLILFSLVTLLICVWGLSGHYSSFFREHKPLRYYTTPTFALYSVFKLAKQIPPAHPQQRQILTPNAAISAQDLHRELIILVVGETARADRFSLNGYLRETNPLLRKHTHLYSYKNITACGTSTAVSVPCMFSAAGRADFDASLTQSQENVLDVLKRAGVNILWRDNNSSSKGIADRVTYQNYKSSDTNLTCDEECRDIGMLEGLDTYVQQQHGDTLIVLHMMGNHGPAYYKRYPKTFERFKPACQDAELSSCSQAEINNAYDNAILYTDYFLSKVIGFLQRHTPAYETAMLYISDHGESLGERGLYLHGMPYALAPHEQIHVPLIVWVGSSSDIDTAKMTHHVYEPSSHDALFNTLLTLFEVEPANAGAAPPFLSLKSD